MTQWWAPTKIRVSGDSSVRGQLLKTVDGDLLCNFPERLVMIANHQIYTDWMYLWWIAYTNGMHGRLYIVLKESLKRIPVIGWGMQFCQFIFLKRNWEKDKGNLSLHMRKLNKPSDPMWLLLFPEGTNLAPNTRRRSKKWADKNRMADMRHTLHPRSTGLQFCLKELRKTVKYVYDCTIAYEGVQRGQFAQDIFTIKASYLEGRPPKSVNMYWRRFPIASIPLDDDKAFERWLRKKWVEKDHLIEIYLHTGQFPADTGVSTTPDGRTLRGAGHIETEVKANKWYESLQIFAPMGLLALILYMFYGALPRKFVRSFTQQGKLEEEQKKRLESAKNLKKQQAMKRLEGAQSFNINMPDLQLLRGAAAELLKGGQINSLDKTSRQKLLIAAINLATGKQNTALSKSALAQTQALGIEPTRKAITQGLSSQKAASKAPSTIMSGSGSQRAGAKKLSAQKAPLTAANVAKVGASNSATRTSTTVGSTTRATSKAPTIQTLPTSKQRSGAPTVYTLSTSTSGSKRPPPTVNSKTKAPTSSPAKPPPKNNNAPKGLGQVAPNSTNKATNSTIKSNIQGQPKKVNNSVKPLSSNLPTQPSQRKPPPEPRVGTQLKQAPTAKSLKPTASKQSKNEAAPKMPSQPPKLTATGPPATAKTQNGIGKTAGSKPQSISNGIQKVAKPPPRPQAALNGINKPASSTAKSQLATSGVKKTVNSATTSQAIGSGPKKANVTAVK
ncbi:MAG: hypothetical protein Q9160_005274 [Pyrenula sp. 1 TL-2023]